MFVNCGLELLNDDSFSKEEKKLNISDNLFKSLESLKYFENLEEIIADNNLINEPLQIPKLLKLHTLSINKNKIKNLDSLLDELVENTPDLVYLSLLGNPVSPDPIYRHLSKLSRDMEIREFDENDLIRFNNYTLQSISDIEIVENDDEYQRYRLRILYRLPKLQFIDSTMVTDEERIEAARRGSFLQLKKLEPVTKIARRANLGFLVQDKPVDWISETIDSPNSNYLHPLGKPQPKPSEICYGRNTRTNFGIFSEGNRFIINHDL